MNCYTIPLDKKARNRLLLATHCENRLDLNKKFEETGDAAAWAEKGPYTGRMLMPVSWLSAMMDPPMDVNPLWVLAGEEPAIRHISTMGEYEDVSATDLLAERERQQKDDTKHEALLKHYGLI